MQAEEKKRTQLKNEQNKKKLKKTKKKATERVSYVIRVAIPVTSDH